MPIYEYECPLCGRFEVTQKVSDKPLKANPGCQRQDCPKKAERLISASAFHLKGSGWYKTDYSSSGSAGKKKSEDKAASVDSGAKSDTKAETKSEAKSDPNKSGKGGGGCGPGCGCH